MFYVNIGLLEGSVCVYARARVHVRACACMCDMLPADSGVREGYYMICSPLNDLTSAFLTRFPRCCRSAPLIRFLLGSADVTFTRFVGHNLIPVTLGNFIGGFLFLGSAQYFAYDNGPAVRRKVYDEIDNDNGGGSSMGNGHLN